MEEVAISTLKRQISNLHCESITQTHYTRTFDKVLNLLLIEGKDALHFISDGELNGAFNFFFLFTLLDSQNLADLNCNSSELESNSRGTFFSYIKLRL